MRRAFAFVERGAHHLGHILQLPPLDARHGIEMPISQEVARVLFDHQSPRRAAEALMARTLKFE